jgi:ZIP family zinc transporter
MSFLQTIILGTVSGLTIFLGMPLARIRTLAKEHLAFLNAFAIGVLFFLFVDIVKHATEPIEITLKDAKPEFWLYTIILMVGFGIGLLSLVYFGRRYLRKGAAVSTQQIALLIAIGIGLHNFSEGLAFGNAAQSGELGFAVLLFVGFGLHNITEAFGIAAPLAGQGVSWRFLLLLGLIGGGPNFLGTLFGYWITSQPIAILFLALAAGAIVYVIGELFASGRKFNASTWNGWGLTLGFFAGLLTDFILVAAGA